MTDRVISPHIFTLADIAKRINATLHGDPDCEIKALAPIDKAINGDLTFYFDPRYKKHLAETNASAVILATENADGYKGNRLVLSDPYQAYVILATIFAPKINIPKGIHDSAVIGENCSIAETVSVAANVSIGNNVTIGRGTVIGSGCVIDDHCTIGEDCYFVSNVSLYTQVKIANRVILHSGVVIGSDGFGLQNNQGRWVKIPQLGGVRIADDVEIGANSTVDRGALADTVIEQGVKIDNQVQIAHNVVIGAHTAIAGCTGIAGSTKIGKHCMIGGGVGIRDHLTITDQVIITAMSGVSKSINTPGVYSAGYPVEPNRVWNKTVAYIHRLGKLYDRVTQLEKKQA